MQTTPPESTYSLWSVNHRGTRDDGEGKKEEPLGSLVFRHHPIG